MSFREDYAFGKTSEERALIKMCKFFNQCIRPTSEFCKWDFESPSTIYELKSRKVYSNTYDEVLINYNKIQPIRKPQYFLFNFIDGLFYIKYDQEVFMDFELKVFKREGRTDYNDKPQVCCYIPNKYLTHIL